MTTNSATLDPVTAAWNTVAYFDSIEDAWHAVGQLSENGFPVDKLDIVTTEVHLVEPAARRPGRIRAVGVRLLRAVGPGTQTTHRYNLVARDGTAGHAWSLLHKAGLDSAPANRQPVLAAS